MVLAVDRTRVGRSVIAQSLAPYASLAGCRVLRVDYEFVKDKGDERARRASLPFNYSCGDGR